MTEKLRFDDRPVITPPKTEGVINPEAIIAWARPIMENDQRLMDSKGKMFTLFVGYVNDLLRGKPLVRQELEKQGFSKKEIRCISIKAHTLKHNYGKTSLRAHPKEPYIWIEKRQQQLVR
ncbi:MAG: hypothetical protein M1268_03320 [Patescibacteria group bacterium]|nr:hypothetical protein [Patescibacteria group bacterium]